MAPPTDPYRTLGLTRDASLEEVKRAYRRLAKENHPDAAGPAALPRFLAIQAAYEQLVEGRGRGARGGTTAGAAASADTAGRASAADPDRADATHRAYAGRSRRTRPGATGTGRARTGRTAPGSSTTGAAGTGSGGTGEAPGGAEGSSAGAAGAAGAGAAAGPAGAASGGGAGAETAGGRRGRGKATLGSTSYDGAEAGPFEPDWGGASWYGTTSGTYWTINPKEYADPRKHGPEYQARARRAARATAEGAAIGSATTSDTGGAATSARTAEAPAADEPANEAAAGDPAVGDRATTEPTAGDPAAGLGRAGPAPTYTRADAPIHTTSSWWGSTAGPTAAGRDEPVDDCGSARSSTDGPGHPSAVSDDALPPDLGAAARQLGRALTDERSARGGWRVAQAAVGWLPIALGVGWAIGELTGCSRSAASCDGADPWLAPIAVLLTLLPLLFLPRLASIAAAGGIAVAIVAVPAAAILSATHDESPSTERSVLLGIVLVIAWLVGVAIAIARRARSADTGGPVS